jgi:hypothetical protein
MMRNIQQWLCVTTGFVFALPALHAGQIEQILSLQAARLNHLENSSNPVGAIVQTIVAEADFQRAYGKQWVVMRGQDVSGSKLCLLFKICRLPNAEGTFLRTTGPQAQVLAERQEAVLPSHAHRLNSSGGAAITFIGNSGAGFTDLWSQEGGPVVTFNKAGSNQGGSVGGGSYTASSVPLVGVTGDSASVSGEVKPLSLTVQTFIRID